MKIVPTTWDDIKFLGGYPGEWVALAKRSGDKWFIGVMNNSKAKTVEIKLDFLQPGNYNAETWADTKNSDKEAKELKKTSATLKSPGTLKIKMAKNGGYVGVISK